MYEAICPRCGEAFNPMDLDDREHVQRGDGEECGGIADRIILRTPRGDSLAWPL